MDRLKDIESLSEAELLDLHQRLNAEIQRRRDRLSAALGDLPAKYQAKSQAKKLFWDAWRAYKAAHPGATREEWEASKAKGQRRGKA